ncbi:hypothetical protein JHN63_24800 [Streptomyces sp. MBT65]|uniref:DUF6461 domain-containing protein n=1 Tax=Streptomyces sp. MBT65 TaxID=1488395 RepID=UPI00190D81E4|nr:DUF6461 domain-containing protein [Streptomyces sp. MBT65]MBK3576961.1 hypothetical protein [Streptomyces sp. MBT65]
MTRTTTADDYTWLRERYASLMEAYCVTLVRAITPDRLLHELGAEPGIRVSGVQALREPSYTSWDDHDGDPLFVGVAALGEWSLMVEYNGFVGVTGAAMLPVSRGRTVVSHFRNVNAMDHFYWFEDGETRLHFEPLFAYARDGSHADELLAEMRESGFELSEDEEEDESYDLHTEAAFALSHRVTGVRLTPELFASLEFTGALVPIPRD